MKYSLIILAIIASLTASYTEANTKKRVHIVVSKIVHKNEKHTKMHVKQIIQSKKVNLIGTSSWYGYESVKKGRRVPLTASGQVFNPHKMTAAHRSLPFGTKVKVTNLHNNQSVLVVINDRGPALKSRIIDLSKSAAHSIGITGLQKVSLNIIN